MAEKLKFLASLVGGFSHLESIQTRFLLRIASKKGQRMRYRKVHTRKGRNNKPKIKSNKITRWLFCIWSERDVPLLYEVNRNSEESNRTCMMRWLIDFGNVLRFIEILLKFEILFSRSTF